MTYLRLKSNDLGRIRACNLVIRSQTPYPLGHKALQSALLEAMSTTNKFFAPKGEYK